ncbi:hypothetical protein [Streptomyces rimosus]|uniref:hypothetical protein n=1 Tax=Streptomyces rimosus TaxID=1927 RepID=UPI0004C4844E|nr:hypothetical protein [Streptomyces rimosus]
MTQDIPAPVPVAELIAQREEWRTYPCDGYLRLEELVRAWPVVADVEAVVKANEVRTATESVSGTWGRTYHCPVFHPGDAQRVADAIADGTAVLQPLWRRDTEEGSEALRQRIEKLEREDMLEALYVIAFALVLVAGLGVLILLSE